jgi:peptidoglycan/xylan/chitin deacetylase (PgdA/CDA1 family)
MKTLYLMYHELETENRPLVNRAPGYVRYAVRAEDFRRQLDHLTASNLRGVSVGEALDSKNEYAHGVCITFDDGCETDYTIAAPQLKEKNFKATFYVIAGFVGRERGYLSETQVRELSDLGFEIGSHSLSHAFLSNLSGEELRREVIESKERLEQLTGRSVEHLSCPGGRWNRRVADAVREAGYVSMATSEIRLNDAGTNPFHLSRIVVMRDTNSEDFARLCRHEGLLRRRTASAIRGTAKRMLGDSVYDKLRSTVLERGRKGEPISEHSN